MKIRNAPGALALLVALAVYPLSGQSLGNAGTIEGIVVDPSGAAVANAPVTIHNAVTDYRRSTVTADTREVLIVVEGLHPAAATDVPSLIDALAVHITDLWGAPRQRAVLTAASPQIELPA